MKEKFKHQSDLLGIFAYHPLAANLLMAMLFLAGIWALGKLNTQFFPTFELETITVRVVWAGASAEDVETSLLIPLEQELRTLDYLRKMSSTAAEGIASITLEYQERSDMATAVERVKDRIAALRNLPQDAEEPEVSRVIRTEPIARLLVLGHGMDLRELRPWARQIEQELLARGVSRVDISGLPEEEMAIQIPAAVLQALGLSPAQVAERIAQSSQDLPTGTLGRGEAARQLRTAQQQRDPAGFAALPLVTDAEGRLLRLADVAHIEQRPRTGQTLVYYQGRPAVELLLQRADTGDTLESAKILQTWLAERQTSLPANLELHVLDETWNLVWQRISLLVNNGVMGLALVVITLLLFLNSRVAFWVAWGIPTAFMATLLFLWLIGGSINMISLFAMIMVLGIIVDDAIVVGEDAYTHYQSGENTLQAAEGGARRMFAPVVASSLTTIVAFVPLLLIGGTIGKILADIPWVVICALMASLLECFLILPSHLRHSFLRMGHRAPSKLRLKLEQGFNSLRDIYFRPVVTASVGNSATTLSVALAVWLLCIGLMAGGRIPFTFFPTPEGNIVYANVGFGAGTPRAQTQAFLRALEQALSATDAELGGGLVKGAITYLGEGALSGAGRGNRGDQFGALMVELMDSEKRTVRNEAFIAAWRKQMQRLPPGLETFTIYSRRGGPPGRDIEIRLLGGSAATLKIAALELAGVLEKYPGVSAIQDDLPYGPEQWLYTLTPQAQALGLTTASIGQQLRAAYDGQLAQLFQQGADEIEVRVVLPDAERGWLASLTELPLMLPDGQVMPLGNAVTFTPRRGFEAVRHAGGELAVEVTADVNQSITPSVEILAQIQAETLPDLTARYGIRYSLEGRAADQRETFADMQQGMLYALLMIYLILAWAFASYGWPLLVMLAIPFSLSGVFFGHWMMGMSLTLMSLFGVFGLAGIVVNDSIVLLEFYRLQRDQGVAVRAAAIAAACQRLRAILLTSLTTMAGLATLLLETSLQAQFLIPMAVSLVFGLMFSTVFVLLAMPALLSLYERFWEAPQPAAATEA